jgi:hypothetical protein
MVTMHLGLPSAVPGPAAAPPAWRSPAAGRPVPAAPGKPPADGFTLGGEQLADNIGGGVHVIGHPSQGAL